MVLNPSDFFFRLLVLVAGFCACRARYHGDPGCGERRPWLQGHTESSPEEPDTAFGKNSVT